MEPVVRRIGVLTSGGDAPGMNAAVRAVVRTAVGENVECVGIRRGWNGLINNDFEVMNGSSVSNIINKGGTILYTARSEEFKTPEGRDKALNTCKLLGLEGIVAIGGDGTFRGALALSRQAAEEVELSERLDAHPYDLSGGEQQRAALAKVLLLRPKILLLDEPTKGLDAQFKEKLAGIFRRLLGQGATILMVSHDVEFCARHADVCTLFFQGGAVVTAPAGPFFSGNSFYTTAANRMSRHLMAGAVTNEDVIDRCNRHAAV